MNFNFKKNSFLKNDYYNININIMSKSDLQVFRENINKFIEQLSYIYPNDKDLVIYRDKVVLYGKVDPRGMVEYFMENIGRFTKHIMEKDDAFFLEDLAIKEVTKNEKYHQLYDKVRLLWIDGMDEETKKAVWQYFIVFVTLGAKITKNTEVICIINNYRKQPISL